MAVNAEDLTKAITNYVPLKSRIHLVAHSRGGLVARLAARNLRSDYDVNVVTCGTPHQGTPLANAGKRLLTAILSSGRAVVDAAFSWDPPSLAGKLLLRGMVGRYFPSEFPEGLRVMQPGNAFVAAMGNEERFPICTWGAEYFPNQSNPGRFASAGKGRFRAPL